MSALKKYPYTDILGWSVSRYEKFRTCQRQYYFDYYAKRHDDEVDKKQLARLRELTTVALEAGNIVHDVCKALFERLRKSNAALDRQRFLDYADQPTEAYCSKKEFMEVYYNEMPSINIVAIKEAVKTYLTVLLDSDRFQWICREAISNSKSWIIEPDGFGETRINELKAYCKVDFLLPLGDKIYIIDWKTGKEDEIKHRKQMLGYTAFACDHFGKGPQDVVCILFYLKSGNEKVFHFNEVDVLNFANSIRSESEEMYGMTIHTESNIPKHKDDFIQTTNPRICGMCNYKALCFPRDNLKASTVDPF
jgi:hypothetical protein